MYPLPTQRANALAGVWSAPWAYGYDHIETLSEFSGLHINLIWFVGMLCGLWIPVLVYVFGLDYLRMAMMRAPYLDQYEGSLLAAGRFGIYLVALFATSTALFLAEFAITGT